MAKKGKKDGVIEIVKDVAEDIISSRISDHIKQTAKDIMLKAQETAYLTEKKLIEGLYASILVLCGLVFVVISLALIINQQFNLETQWGFMIMGLVLVIIGMIVMQHMKKTRLMR